MYWRPWRWQRDGWLGAWVGVILSAALALAGRLLGQPVTLVVGLTAVPFGAVVGGRYGLRITGGASRIQVGLRAGLVACLIAAIAWFALMFVASFVQPVDVVPDRLAYLLYLALVIPGSVAIVGLPFALPLGVAGAVLLRAVGDHPKAGVTAMTIISGVVVTIAVVMWLA